MPTPSGLVTKAELIDAQLDTAHLGRVVNSKDAAGNPISQSTNRTGGVNATLNALLAKIGLYSVGFWTDDPTLTEVNQYVRDNSTGLDYQPVTLPYTVNSALNPDPETLVTSGVLKRVNEVTQQDLIDQLGLLVGGSVAIGDPGNIAPPGTTHLILGDDLTFLQETISTNAEVISYSYDDFRGLYTVSTDDGDFTTKLFSDEYSNHSSVSDPILQRITGAANIYDNEDYPNSDYIGDFTYLLPTTDGVGDAIFIDRLPDKSFKFRLDVGKFLGTSFTHLWVSRFGDPGSSGSFYSPLLASEFVTKVNNGDYNTLGSVLIVHFTDDVYYRDDMPANFGVITGTRFILDGSTAPSGRSLITASYELTWNQTSANLYNAQLPTSTPAVRVIDTKTLDDLGLPTVFKPVASSAEREPGTFWMEGTVLHIQTISTASGGEEGILAAPSGNYRGDMNDISSNVLIESVDFFHRGHRCNPTTKDVTIVYDKCHFLSGSDDAWYVDKPEYRIIHNECIAKASGKDGFNYHNYNSLASDDGTAIEVNCKAYDAGLYKYADGNQTNISNNGSTAHDGSTIFRFGGDYWDCEGSTIADVGGCKTINYGVKAWRPTDSTDPAYLRAFWFTDGSGPTAVSQYTTVTVDCEALGYKEGDDELFYQRNDNWYFDNVNVSGQSMYLDSANAKRMR